MPSIVALKILTKTCLKSLKRKKCSYYPIYFQNLLKDNRFIILGSKETKTCQK